MGGYCPTVDRPEQLLDTVQEAITNVGMTVGEDVYFGINCAAHEMFDLVRLYMYDFIKSLINVLTH